MKAFAIMDTDGGRTKPKPLVRHIYATREAAVSARAYRKMAPEFYPVAEVCIGFENTQALAGMAG